MTVRLNGTQCQNKLCNKIHFFDEFVQFRLLFSSIENDYRVLFSLPNGSIKQDPIAASD